MICRSLLMGRLSRLSVVPQVSFSVTTRELQDLFVDPEIHNLLRLVTYTDPKVVHQPHMKKFLKTNIQLLNEKELETVKRFSAYFTNQRLQMPPVLMERPEEDKNTLTISKDPGLQGLLPSNYRLVFTDISTGESPRHRLIVVREPDGTLRHASASERDRISAAYFSLPGRRARVPLMFYAPYLQDLLHRGQYEYILDRACNQFEPDDPDYVRVCQSVYSYINSKSWMPIHSGDGTTHSVSRDVNPLRLLRHTRHYGPLALYLISYFDSPGGLVYEALHCQHYSRLGWLLRLILLLRPRSPFAMALRESKLRPPPPEVVDASTMHLSNEAELHLTATDIHNILSYVQLFVDREPLAESQKQTLLQLVESCRSGLETDNQESVG